MTDDDEVFDYEEVFDNDTIYWKTVENIVVNFATPIDKISLVDIFFEPGIQCGVCGKRPINNGYVLKNEDTGAHITAGRECLSSILSILKNMSKGSFSINVLPHLTKEADKLREKYGIFI